MDFDAVLRRRRMVRSFSSTPVPADVLDEVLRAGLRAPSAGNTQGTEFVVLEGPEQTARYWDVTLPIERRTAFAWPGLLAAPVLVLPLVSSRAYLERYSEPDKAGSGLGDAVERWPVAYWCVDAAFAAMLLQLAAIDRGLGVLFFGIFDGRDELLAALGVPSEFDPIGTIALGYPSGDDRPSESAARARRTLDDVVHRGAW